MDTLSHFSFKFKADRAWAGPRFPHYLTSLGPWILSSHNNGFPGSQREALDNMCCPLGLPVDVPGTLPFAETLPSYMGYLNKGE